LNDSLPIVETFHSVQGEGVHTGRSAFFIRLAGCDVGCSWCDTKHSWPAEAHPWQSIAQLADQADNAARQGAAFTVITGGEPLQNDLTPLTTALHSAIKRPVHVETSGVHPLRGAPDWITLSPKRHRPPLTELLEICHELKVVVFEQADLDFAEEIALCVSSDSALLLQPGWGSELGQQLAIDHVQHHPLWRMSLQTHKWLNVR